jgi:hypothetical protein
MSQRPPWSDDGLPLRPLVVVLVVVMLFVLLFAAVDTLAGRQRPSTSLPVFCEQQFQSYAPVTRVPRAEFMARCTLQQP